MMRNLQPTIHTSKDGLIIHSLYGTFTLHEPIIQELIATPTFARLKLVHQYGIGYFVGPKKGQPYTRFDHSIGVFLLLHKFNAPLPEQIAGLLHDVSHTVFSHVGDLVFSHSSYSDSYQDEIHSWFINQTEIPAILHKYGLDVDTILHKNEEFIMLEQPRPNICADRLEYTLYSGYLDKLLTYDQVHAILADLAFADGNWYFTDVALAKLFATASLTLTEHHYAAIWNTVTYYWVALALQRATYLNFITHRELHFATDAQIWQRLQELTDPYIAYLVGNLNKCDGKAVVSDKNDFDIHIKPKMRGINPWVKVDGQYKRLTKIDAGYKDEFERVKDLTYKGLYVKFY